MGSRNPVCIVRMNDTGSIVFQGDSIALAPTQNQNVVLTGVLEAEVVNTSYYNADTFTVHVALGAAPPWFTPDYLSTQAYIPIQVLMGPDANDLPTLIEGLVDDFDYDPVQNTVELHGRDYTRFFIDTKTTEKWANQSIAQVVVALATKHGLGIISDPTLLPGQANASSSVMDTSNLPSAQVGEYLNQYQAKIGDARTEWDFLTWLSSMVVDADTGLNFVTFVTGQALYFGPRPDTVDYTITCQPASSLGQPFTILPAADPKAGPAWGGTSIKFHRNLSVLRNVVVEMRSQQSGASQSLVASYPKAFKGVQVGASATKQQLYQFEAKANTPADQLLQQAQARQQEISRHEVRISLELPGDSVLTQASLLQVSGVAQVFDQSYFINSVTRHFTEANGYTMECEGQNRAVSDEAAL